MISRSCAVQPVDFASGLSVSQSIGSASNESRSALIPAGPDIPLSGSHLSLTHRRHRHATATLAGVRSQRDRTRGRVGDNDRTGTSARRFDRPATQRHRNPIFQLVRDRLRLAHAPHNRTRRVAFPGIQHARAQVAGDMGKIQHRRTVSMTAILYARLSAHCKRRNIPMAAFVEAVLVDALDDEGEPVPVIVPTGYPKRRRESTAAQARDIATRPAACITF